MSQSLLFKNIVSKNLTKSYIFIVYKQQYKNNKTTNNSTITPLQICYNHKTTLQVILNYYINELYKTKTIICPKLLHILNSKKPIESKLNSIKLEYNNMFENNPDICNSDTFESNIFEFKYKLVPKNILSVKIFQHEIRKKLNKHKIKYSLYDYNLFYKYNVYKIK